MNDQELTSVVKQQLASIRMSTPLDSIVVRGQALRTRRFRTLTGACAALSTAIALAVMALLPAASTVPAALTAWTVARASDGTVTVTIRDLRDPARLQARLRMDGVPASVTSTAEPNPACRAPRVPVRNLTGIFSAAPPRRNEQVIVIHPAGLPAGVGVQLSAAWATGSKGLNSSRAGALASPGAMQQTIVVQFAGAPDSGRRHHQPALAVLSLGLVGSSPACTGSAHGR